MVIIAYQISAINMVAVDYQRPLEKVAANICVLATTFNVAAIVHLTTATFWVSAIATYSCNVNF